MKKMLPLVLLATLSNAVFGQKKETITVNFDFDKSELTSESISKLDEFTNSISQSEITSIFIGGHCDSKGTNEYNDALSLRRVNTVRNYLAGRKINPALITTKGFGENNLLNMDSTEDDSRQNRRVEIIAATKAKPAAASQERTGTKTLTAALADSTVKIGAVISVPNLEFYNNSDLVLPKSEPTMHELLNILAANPKLKISIEGHICCVPYDAGLPLEQQGNYNISVIRAKMLYDFLIRNGIQQGRLSYKAFGNSRPLFPIPEETEEQRIANRRVEIRILDK